MGHRVEDAVEDGGGHVPFRVMVHGRFEPAQTEDGPKARGFITARTVYAADASAAGEAVVALVAQDERLPEYMRQFGSAQPAIEVAEIFSLEADDEIDMRPQGFILYDESGRPIETIEAE